MNRPAVLIVAYLFGESNSVNKIFVNPPSFLSKRIVFLRQTRYYENKEEAGFSTLPGRALQACGRAESRRLFYENGGGVAMAESYCGKE